MATSCGIYSALLFYGFLQYFYMKHVSLNINYEGDWTIDRFDIFLTKINSAERSVFFVECLSKLTQRTVMAKWRTFETCKISTRNNYFLIIALLLSGDISLNPRPVKFPCIGCTKPVKSNQQALQCDFCDQWIHRRCTNPLMAEPEYNRLGQSSDNFYCHNCTDRLPLLSDSFFDRSDIADETFSTNSSIFDTSATSSYLPSAETTTFQSHDPDIAESGDARSHDINSDQNGGSDVFDELRKARRKNRDHVFISYLNVNSFRYKFMELSDIYIV